MCREPMVITVSMMSNGNEIESECDLEIESLVCNHYDNGLSVNDDVD